MAKRTLRLNGSTEADLDRAAHILRDGGLVAFPTETVYGLGADGLDADAVGRAFDAKGRPADNPVILHVPDLERALGLWQASDVELSRARACAEAFWPGPLTLVLDAAASVPSVVTAGLPSVAVRVPDHPVALALLEKVGRPLAAPSANVSGRPSPTAAEHVLRTLDGRIDAVVDGGATRVGVESTVLDLRGELPRVLRRGDVTRAALAQVLGEVGAFAGAEDKAPSPGLRHRHYAPDVEEVTVARPTDLEAAWESDAGLLLRESTNAELEERLGPRDAPTEVLEDTPGAFARELYGALYRLEGEDPPRLLIEEPPAEDAWAVVRDRVRRAAGKRGPGAV